VVIHPIIDACLELRQAHAIDPADIAGVSVKVSQKALALTDRPHPKDRLGARVSLQHWVALSFIRGTARIADMDINGAADEASLHRLQDKVITIADDSIGMDGAEVTVVLQSGRSVVSHVEHCVGSASNPMTGNALDQKFIGLAKGVLGSRRAQELLEMSWGVERLSDVSVLPAAAA
jgi:2-methylcitrate dehydratase PrpD